MIPSVFSNPFTTHFEKRKEKKIFLKKKKEKEKEET